MKFTFEATLEVPFCEATFEVLDLFDFRVIEPSLFEIDELDDFLLKLALVILKSDFKLSSSVFRSSLSLKLVSENLRMVGGFFKGFTLNF